MASNTERPHRVAIYFAPALDSDWWQVGSQWLGRCAATGNGLEQTGVAGLSREQFWQATHEPRRYGWHATLKAPFSLKQEHSLDDVLAALGRLCQQHKTFALAPLRAAWMGNFLALRPQPQQPELNALATDCVRALHPLAQPLSAAQLAKRRSAALTPEQDALLQTWGYPWVLQQYRFHLSLTGPVHTRVEAQRQALMDAAVRQFHALPGCLLDRVSVFVEPTEGADFQLLEQIRLAP